MSGWATFSPDTEAMTAISAMQTAIRIVRSWRASGAPPPLASAVADRAGGFVLMDSSQKGQVRRAGAVMMSWEVAGRAGQRPDDTGRRIRAIYVRRYPRLAAGAYDVAYDARR